MAKSAWSSSSFNSILRNDVIISFETTERHPSDVGSKRNEDFALERNLQQSKAAKEIENANRLMIQSSDLIESTMAGGQSMESLIIQLYK